MVLRTVECLDALQDVNLVVKMVVLLALTVVASMVLHWVEYLVGLKGTSLAAETVL